MSLPYFSQAQLMRSMVRFSRAYNAGEDVTAWTRYETGYSLPMATAVFTDQRTITDEFGNVTYKYYSHNATATNAMGAVAGTYFPISNLGDNSIMAIAVAVKGNIYVFNTGNVSFDTISTDYEYNYDFVSIEMGVPVSLDLKFGCDATQNKNNRFCFTGGIGMAPTLIATGLPSGFNSDGSTALSDASAKLLVEPFLKAEVGAMLGICFKVRAMYSFGRIKYYDNGNDYQHLSIIGKSNLTVSLILMPFSWAWKKSRF